VKKLRVLCPQEYAGIEMRATPCSRCAAGWDKTTKTCTIPTGGEHLPLVSAVEIPECPLQDRCQHQLQVAPAPCTIRARGLICESALAWAGVPDPMSHPLGFSAECVASPEELASYSKE
jgi:hypothetical protein